MRNIYVSGGWGYRNLGDDSILKVTCEIINRLFPVSDKIISSYDKRVTAEVVDDSEISVVESVDRLLFGKYYTNKWIGYKKVENYSRLNSFIKRGKGFIIRGFVNAFSKIHLLLILHLESYYISILKRSRVYKSFRGVNLFIMSGGGYFNSWETSLVSRYVEIKMAKLAGAKVVLVGQTIGPFLTRAHRKVAKKCLRDCDAISVRDRESFMELQGMEIICENQIIPDLSLMKTYQYQKKDIITIVPFYEGIEEYGFQIAEVLNEIQGLTGYKIRITISQQWAGVFEKAVFLHEIFRNVKCNVEFSYPLNVDELQVLLGESKIVVSQNLHGLILAYRANASIISLNNKRKFLTFMEIIDRDRFVFPMTNFDKVKFRSSILDCVEEYAGSKPKTVNKNFSSDIENCLASILLILKG